MALSNMAVFNRELAALTVETIAQNVEAFNAASGNAIVLTPQGFEGDYLIDRFWSSLSGAQRRVDRYATNSTQTATALAQKTENSVKVAGGFGPILYEPAQMTYMLENPAVALEVASRNLADVIMKDQLNAGIKSAVAAIGGNSDATFAAAASAFTYVELNSAHALFGDASTSIICNVMNGAMYHGLIGLNLANAQTLFSSNTVQVVDILGKKVVVTDSPSLAYANTGKTSALGLTEYGIVISDGSDIVTNSASTNGKLRIENTFQADYTFGVGVKGYSWDTTSGGKSPTDAELATAANWDVVHTSVKSTAGVVAQFVTPA
jgi:hypothetical protein